MSRRVAIIANPIAGGGRGARAAAELARQLEARSVHATVTLTQRAGDARARARQLADEKPWAVVAAGGDGTVNEVLNGLVDPSLRLAVLPIGTANVLACELGLPAEPAACAEVVDHGREIRAAIGLAAGRRFLLFTGVGLDGRMVARLEEIRRGPLGKRRWLAPVLHVVWRWPLDRLRVTTAEGERRDDLSEVLVTRVRSYGGVFELPSGIDIEDGKLHVLCFRQRTRLRYLAAAWRAWRGTLRPGIDVDVLVTSGAHVEADRAAPYQVDGDGGGETPLEITLASRFARILAPPL